MLGLVALATWPADRGAPARGGSRRRGGGLWLVALGAPWPILRLRGAL
ncbi:MAG: hypothetical protein ACLPN5_13115 [Roseiarcus sp.]